MEFEDDVFSSRENFHFSKLPNPQANYAKEMMAEEERLQRLLELRIPVANEGLDGWDFLQQTMYVSSLGG